MYLKFIGIVAGLSLWLGTVQAQNPVAPPPARQRFLEVGISANAYRGDLTNRYQKWSSAFQAGLKLNHTRRLSGHFGLAIGTLTGQNPAYVFTGESDVPPTPNRFFRTPFFSVQYDLHLHLWRHKHWTAYISQGIGLMRFTPRNDQKQNLQDLLETRPADEAYSNITLLIPTQAGIMYLFDNQYGVALQAGWMNPLTDYIDNISQWGNRSKKDNAAWVKFLFVVPLKTGNL